MILKRFHFLLAAMLAVVIWGSQTPQAAAQSVDSKFTLISAYIYNFTQLTTFPSAAVKDSFTVCIVGQDPFGANLDPIKSRKVNDERISVKHFGGTEGDLSSCNVLFVSGSERANLQAILKPLKGAPVLTMSDISGFADSGGMVEFKLEDGKVGIWIDLSAVRAPGISISSKLLSLANIR